ncbi:MAG TPA: N,N-dimethylformamidase beta subunit family domain-containing protein [Baekduia sp.]|nr:N,N-dimethylformamidase beta subunit family domain-containing protein [Baekduia sp.]
MTRAKAAAFLTLVAATFAAFFVAQELKSGPSVVQRLTFSGVLSPNGDGRKDTVRINFLLKEADDVTVQVADEDGDPVRTLVEDRAVRAYDAFDEALRWDGRDDDGRRVADGRYRLRIVLQGQGRTIVPPRSVRVDTTPPQPLVASVGPDRSYGPELLPKAGGGPATVRFASAALARPRALLFKLAPGRPRLVRDEPLRQGDATWSWDGTLRGRRASSGTYLVVLEWRDEAGNVGTSAPLDRRGLPRLPRGERLPGRGGITVRNLGVQGPSVPVRAGQRVTFGIDARRRRYTWSVRRVGSPAVRSRGRGTRSPIRVKAPRGVSGTYLFEVRTRRHRTAVPFVVQARRPRSVLVVLPWSTWQGRNPGDDDGDGAPDVLDRGVAARLERIFVTGDGLPPRFAIREAPVLGWLDRTGRRYDLTTDAALERGAGPRLRGHKGVLIPGDARWLGPRVRRELRAFVRAGGTLASLGTDSLRRRVGFDLSGRSRLVDPRPAAATDLFGARLRPLARLQVDLTVSPLPDELQFFAGTDGTVTGLDAWEETAALGRELEHAASAVTVQPPGKTVIAAARFGRGLVVRFGIPDVAQRLTPDPTIATLMGTTWTLLSR